MSGIHLLSAATIRVRLYSVRNLLFVCAVLCLIPQMSCAAGDPSEEVIKGVETPHSTVTKTFKTPESALDFISKTSEPADNKKLKEFVIKTGGTLTAQHWLDFEAAVKSQKRTQFFLDFSACAVDEKSEAKSSDGYVFNAAELPGDFFSDCATLSGIRFPDGLREIGYRAFSSCKNLRKVYFPKTPLEYLGVFSFCDNPSLDEVHIYALECPIRQSFKECGEISLLVVPETPVFLDPPDFSGYYQYPFGQTNVKTVRTPTRTLTMEEWRDECRVMIPKAVDLTSVTASSSAAEKYAPEKICDGTWNSWVEGVPGAGEGEKLDITFAEPTTVRYLTIKNGFGNITYFFANNRVKELEITFDGDSSTVRTVTLNDSPYAEYVSLNDYKLRKSIQLTIKSVYAGNGPDNDTCIAEVVINAGLQRTPVYGQIYDSPERTYVYDPETARMLAAVFIPDVGKEKVKFAQNGTVQVKRTEWDSNEEYWSQLPGALNGILESDYFPGTGAGSISRPFRIFVRENGRHLLFCWYETSGDFSMGKPDAQLAVSVWENASWKRLPDLRGETSLAEVLSLFSTLLRQKTAFNFFAEQNSILFMPTVQSGSSKFSVSVEFIWDNNRFTAKTTAQTVAAFGSPADFESIPNWQSALHGYKKNAPLILYAAAFNNNVQMTRFLLQNGAKVDVDLKNGMSTLQARQAGKNTKEVERLLLDAGAIYSTEMLFDALKENDLTRFTQLLPLVDRSYELFPEIVSYFDRNSRNDRTKTVAETRRILSLVQNTGYDLTQPYDDETFLQLAVERGAFELADMLLEAGCDPNAVALDSYYNRPPLFIVLSYSQPNSVEMAQKLIAAGASVQPWKDLSPILFAIEYNGPHTVDMIRLLIDNGADVNARDTDEKTPLYYVSKNFLYSGNFIPQLLDAGAVLNMGNQDDQTFTEFLMYVLPFYCSNDDYESSSTVEHESLLLETVRALRRNGHSLTDAQMEKDGVSRKFIRKL